MRTFLSRGARSVNRHRREPPTLYYVVTHFEVETESSSVLRRATTAVPFGDSCLKSSFSDASASAAALLFLMKKSPARAPHAGKGFAQRRN